MQKIEAQHRWKWKPASHAPKPLNIWPVISDRWHHFSGWSTILTVQLWIWAGKKKKISALLPLYYPPNLLNYCINVRYTHFYFSMGVFIKFSSSECIGWTSLCRASLSCVAGKSEELLWAKNEQGSSYKKTHTVSNCFKTCKMVIIFNRDLFQICFGLICRAN